MSTFQKELESLINRYSKENDSNTPDFILAEYMNACLQAFDHAVNQREKWYGRTAGNIYSRAPVEIEEIAKTIDGTIKDVQKLPDGSGFTIMSIPLPSDHWIYEKDEDGFFPDPPMPLRTGTKDKVYITIGDHTDTSYTREELAALLREAGKYAVRGATMGGMHDDFDPDALIQNLIVGALGYWTDDGTSEG